MPPTFDVWVCVRCEMAIDDSNEHQHQGEGHDVRQLQLAPVEPVAEQRQGGYVYGGGKGALHWLETGEKVDRR